MIRAKEIEEYFSNLGEVYFICSERHPFSCKHQVDYNLRINILKKNLRELKNVFFLRFEDLVLNYDNEISRLLNFLPDLLELDRKKVKTSHSSKGTIKDIFLSNNYNKSNQLVSNFNTKYMKSLGYNTKEPFVENFDITNLNL